VICAVIFRITKTTLTIHECVCKINIGDENEVADGGMRGNDNEKRERKKVQQKTLYVSNQ
jgi:hypothetical protein